MENRNQTKYQEIKPLPNWKGLTQFADKMYSDSSRFKEQLDLNSDKEAPLML